MYTVTSKSIQSMMFGFFEPDVRSIPRYLRASDGPSTGDRIEARLLEVMVEIENTWLYLECESVGSQYTFAIFIE